MAGICFEVPGTPVPKQSTRFTGSGCYTQEEIKAWQNSVAWGAKQACMVNPYFELISKPKEVYVQITFYVPDRRRRDIDNLCKPVLDACNGILWDDDSQVSKSDLERNVDARRSGIEMMVIERV